MGRLPVFYGYLGTVPFIIFFLMTLVMKDDPDGYSFLAALQMAYATMILSFLGGVHWGQAIPRNHARQMHFAMLPTIIGFVLMAAVPFTGAAFPLLAAAGAFWLVYWADRKWMPADYIPEGYFQYRRRLTFIVSLTLGLSALITM